MTATLSHETSGSPVAFQLADSTGWVDPWPMYRSLRDHDPVHHVIPAGNPAADYYVLSRHADIWAGARDHQTFSSAQGLTVNYGLRYDSVNTVTQESQWSPRLGAVWEVSPSLRLHAGLENPDDLIRDLEFGLSQI